MTVHPLKSLARVARTGRPKNLHGGAAWKHLRPKSHWELEARSWCRRLHYRPGPDVMTRIVETLIRADAGDVDAQDWLACEENRLQALVEERGNAERHAVHLNGNVMTRTNLRTDVTERYERSSDGRWELMDSGTCSYLEHARTGTDDVPF